MVNRLVVLLTLPCLVLGCAASSGGDDDARERAAVCARSWRAKGFTFDPNTMTCAQMFERAQAIRNAVNWRQRGYAFDPNLMTAREMDRKAAELRKMGVQEYPPAAPTEAAEAAEAKAPIQPEDAGTRRMLQKMTVTQFRRRYPQYNDMDDMELTRAIHDRYFSDVPFSDFARRFLGYQP